MTIEIHRPELEALILQRMATGGYETAEELLGALLSPESVISSPLRTPDRRSGRVLLEAMQSCPYPEADLEPERFPMPVSDPVCF